MIFTILRMENIHCASILISLLGAAAAAQAASPFVVTASTLRQTSCWFIAPAAN